MVGLNFQYRNPNQENGDTAQDNWLNRRPRMFANSVNIADFVKAGGVVEPGTLSPVALATQLDDDVAEPLKWLAAVCAAARDDTLDH
ncbi:MAG: hypothetical protein AB9869_22895 [Verrucomicrobiia bacterium]